ncbi:MAG TPA: nitrite/sulfite reductase [Geoalkalibacter subterraneus]|uniref:Nitrite/sulfite reductase n=1 Tax=Geoalkalibacter subterraneus TaxID=483547 RepID=A0A831LRR0_9BACT|nr:nitrite/sulfite reductase [Geoalkalibacter subterraneus]
MTSDTPQKTAVDFHKLRLDGVYRMNDQDELMLRIKVPAGVLSVAQAGQVAELADSFAGGRLHLTTRGSIELHRVQVEDLASIGRGLASVGLTSRGACGGAVRGITCSTSFSPRFGTTQALARRLHRHFAGNPHFEGLPKKFKIAVEDGYQGARHLIQDVGLVLVETHQDENRFDVWVGGGLGREPQAAILLEEKVSEKRIIPLIEAVVRTYRKHTAPPRRLKYLLRTQGESTFRRLLQQELGSASATLIAGGLDAAPEPGTNLEATTARIFAGDLDTTVFRNLVDLAARHAEGFLVLTADQNIALAPRSEKDAQEVNKQLMEGGFSGSAPEQRTTFRVCVGNHACRMGLCATRDVARQAQARMPETARDLDWAISGCPNSCSQPQLADFGIVTSGLVKDENGVRQPRFDLYRRTDGNLGKKIKTGLNLQDLMQIISQVLQ